LQAIWTPLYNLSVAPLTRFYNTVTMGILGIRRTSNGFLPRKRRTHSSAALMKNNFQAMMDELQQSVKASTPLFDPA